MDHFYSKVVGVTFKNRDGQRRQDLIPQCQKWERLVLDHEADNPEHPNAVKVCRQGGQQIGYLDSRLAHEVVSRSSRGYRYGAFVSGVTGGTEEKPTLGVNLLILVAEPGESDEDAQRYASTIDLDEGEPWTPGESHENAHRYASTIDFDQIDLDEGEPSTDVGSSRGPGCGASILVGLLILGLLLVVGAL